MQTSGLQAELRGVRASMAAAQQAADAAAQDAAKHGAEFAAAVRIWSCMLQAPPCFYVCEPLCTCCSLHASGSLISGLAFISHVCHDHQCRRCVAKQRKLFATATLDAAWQHADANLVAIILDAVPLDDQ